MATGKSIESIWLGDILTWHLPTNYKDMPYPPCGALKAWAVDAGLRDGDKVVLHHVASVGEVVSRPDGVRDRAVGIRRTTKTASMSGYMAIAAPEWAQPPTDVPSAGATAEWTARRDAARNEVPATASDAKNDMSATTDVLCNAPVLYDIPEGAVAPNGCKIPAGSLTAEQVAAACGGTVVNGVVQVHVDATNDVPRVVIEEPGMEPTPTAIDMIVQGWGEVLLEDAANYLRITVEQVEQLIDEGALSGRRVGDVWYVDAASVAKLYHMPKCNDTKTSNEDMSDIATVNERRDEPTIALPSQDECHELVIYTALDNANERLHGDVARLNIELSTLCQCFGRLQGVIEVKTGVDVSEHMGDPVALTKALIAALMPNRTPYIGSSIATGFSNEEASRVVQDAMPHFANVASPKQEERHCVAIGDNETVALHKTPATTDDQLFTSAKAAGDDLKQLLRELDAPRTVAPTTDTNFLFDDLGKNHREPG